MAFPGSIVFTDRYNKRAVGSEVHYTFGSSAETASVNVTTYTIILSEVPLTSPAPQVNSAYGGGGTVYTETAGIPGLTEYNLDYATGVLTFNVAAAGITLYIDYYGTGSIVWAEDVTNVQNACEYFRDNSIDRDGTIPMTGDLDLDSYDINNIDAANFTTGNGERLVMSRSVADAANEVSITKTAGSGEALIVTNSSTGNSLKIADTGSGSGISLVKASNGSGIAINYTIGTGSSILIDHAGADPAIAVVCNSGAAGLDIIQTKNANAVIITKTGVGAGNCIDITNGGTGESLTITQNGANTAVEITQALADQTGLVINHLVNGPFTNPALQLNYASSAGQALYINNTGAASDGIWINNAVTTGVGLYIISAATSGNSLSILSTSTASAAINISAKSGLDISQDVSSGYGAYIHRNLNEAGTNPLVKLLEDHTASTQIVLAIQNDGTGAAISVSGIATNYALTDVRSCNDATNRSSFNTALTNVGAGAVVGMTMALASTGGLEYAFDFLGSEAGIVGLPGPASLNAGVNTGVFTTVGYIRIATVAGGPYYIPYGTLV